MKANLNDLDSMLKDLSKSSYGTGNDYYYSDPVPILQKVSNIVLEIFVITKTCNLHIIYFCFF
jgi:hypothetical protein